MIKKFLLLFLLIGFIPVVQVVQVEARVEYKIRTMTPEVKAALERRRDRFQRLRKLKKEGIIGENFRGYIEVLEKNTRADELVLAENSNRKLIYKTIVKQNNLEGALESIEVVFAQVQREQAEVGDRIQTQKGHWIVK